MIESFGSLAAISLALVFAVAAITKLMAPAKTTVEFTNLGIPMARLVARCVPAAELIVAGLLLATPRLGGLGAVLLISGFTAVLLHVLQSGRSVSCGCLGALSREPVTYWTIARNGWLLMLAAVASSIETLGTPDLPAVMICGSLLLLITLASQLIKLRGDVGMLWQITLAGEQEPELILDLEIDLNQQVERLVPSNSSPITERDKT